MEQLIKATGALEAILFKTVHKLPLGTSIVVVRVGTFVEEPVIVWNVVRNGKSGERNGRWMEGGMQGVESCTQNYISGAK